jgi:hypothetical protein
MTAAADQEVVHMQSLSGGVTRAVFKLAISFIAIVVVLASASIGLNAYQDYRSSDVEVVSLKSARQAFLERRRSAEATASTRAVALKAASRSALERRIIEIDASVTALSAPVTLREMIQVASLSAASDAVLQKLERDAKIALLQSEREFIVRLLDFKVGSLALVERHDAQLAAYAKLTANEYTQALLHSEHPYMVRIPGTAASKQLARLQDEHGKLLEAHSQAHRMYEDQKKVTEMLHQPELGFERVAYATKGALQELDAYIAQHEREIAGSWVEAIVRAVKRVGATAAWILAGIVIAPVAIKVVFFYVLAPLASRRPPICLLPDASGVLAGIADGATGARDRASVSSVSLPLRLEPAEALLVHPDFLQSSGAGSRMATQWVLDWRYLFTSLAAGMRMLTRIRAEQDEVVVVSATRDPLTEVCVLSLPAGTSFVLQPRCLVGAIHPATQPLRISSQWRLWSLHAWLTLQLRYLVFHGPARLIVRGCRGVRVERAGDGRRINQAATIGWSANLRYTTSRSETFAAYLLGQRDLLNDSFAGEDGYYVYEEIPDRRRAGGITGRGLEGMTDALLKAFGI